MTQLAYSPMILGQYLYFMTHNKQNKYCMFYRGAILGKVSGVFLKTRFQAFDTFVLGLKQLHQPDASTFRIGR